VKLGTKWPSYIQVIISTPRSWLCSFTIISTCNQSAPCEIVSLQAAPRAAKSAERSEGAMIALGGMMGG